MKTLPVLCGGERIGDAEREDDRLYIRVTVRAALRRGLWCAWGIGGRGDVRIGVLEPVNGESVISRRFSRRSLADAGELSRVELRPASESVSATSASEGVSVTNAAEGVSATSAAEGVSVTNTAESASATNTAADVAGTNAGAWTRTGTARLFKSLRFQRRLRNTREALTRTDGDRRRVALIREEDAPFPIPELFCLATPARIGARDYWVFAFDRQEWPVL